MMQTRFPEGSSNDGDGGDCRWACVRKTTTLLPPLSPTTVAATPTPQTSPTQPVTPDDFEDACAHIDNKEDKRAIQLVADSLRLGGAILGQYPDMLAPQLVGREAIQ